MTRPDRRLAIGLFVLALPVFAWFYGGAGWNQDAQFDLARALVERRTLYIDLYNVNTGDTSEFRGHIYINKAPGVSFLAAVPYAVVYGVEKVIHVSPDRAARVNQWIVTVATSGVCGALIPPLLYLDGRRRFRARPVDALCIAIAIAFGTIVFVYSTMLFAHVASALFLLVAVTWFEERPLLAGAAAGIATACFYLCALPAALLALLLIRERRALLRFVAGGLPFALLLGLYQWRCFGSPFRTAVEASTQFTQRGLIFGVFNPPDPEALLAITFSPFRGLFFVSPFLLLAIPALFTMTRRSAIAVGGTFLLFLVAVSSFNGWNGGYAFGPRYLLPAIPLLGLPMLAASSMRSRPIRIAWIAAALVSVFINFLAVAVDPMPSPDVADPVRQYLVPAFFTGRISEETRAAFPWYGDRNVGHVSLPRDAMNLGELMFGRRRAVSVLPAALWMVLGTALLIRLSRSRPARA